MSSTGETLHRLLHAYRAAMRSGYARLDIDQTVSHIRVLKAIVGRDGITAGEIAQAMRQDKARITRLVRDLIADALVTGQAHPRDSRRRPLQATTTGVQLRARIADVEESAAEQMARGLSADELAQFTYLAETLITNLETNA